MGDKSSAAEGSGIFESLFGGFSNGLSIFSNNPFRRKAEVVVPSSADRDDASAGGGEGEEERHLLKSLLNEGLIGEEAVDIVAKGGTITESIEIKEFKVKNYGKDENAEAAIQYQEKKKPKGVEEEEEKELKSFVAGNDATAAAVADADGENNCRSRSSEGRKRKQDPPPVQMDVEAVEGLGPGGGGGTEFKKKKQKKKSTAVGAAESEEQLVLRQSARNLKKRQKQELEQQQQQQQLLQSGEELEKVGKKGKSLSTSAAEVKKKSSSKVAGKRSQEQEGEEGAAGGGSDTGKKKLKRSKKVERSSEAGAIDTTTTPGMETRSGTKRKKGSTVEDLYESKRRETVEGGKEATSIQPEHGSGLEAEVGGRSGDAAGQAGKVRRKRKVGNETEHEMEKVEGGKRKKMTTRDTEERLKRTVFVGNLPVTVKAKQLSREFSQFGRVESARLRSVPLVDTKLPRRAAVITGKLNESRTSLNGYVVFENEESARAALAHNMTLFNGKHLRVDMATAPRKGESSGGESGIEYDRTRSIFVGNLPFDVEVYLCSILDLYATVNGKKRKASPWG